MTGYRSSWVPSANATWAGAPLALVLEEAGVLHKARGRLLRQRHGHTALHKCRGSCSARPLATVASASQLSNVISQPVLNISRSVKTRRFAWRACPRNHPVPHPAETD